MQCRHLRRDRRALKAADGERAQAARFKMWHQHARPCEQELHVATVKAVNLPEIAARLAADGAIASGNTPEQFGKDIRAETAMWARVIREAKIKLD